MWDRTTMHQHYQYLGHSHHVASRSFTRQPDAVSRDRVPFLTESQEPSMVKRASSTCGAGDDSSECQKPTSTTTTTTLPVVLGAVVPIICAIIVLIYLHRRNLKKLRSEDANDRHKSLDFGLDMAPTTGAKSMREAEKGNSPYNHTKGVSMDIGPNPYLLPPGVHGSRDSFHSMSRSIGDDKYRPAGSFFGSDSASLKSHQKSPFHDDAASFTGSTTQGALGDDINQGLLGNAQRMSRSSPPLYNSPSVEESTRAPIGDKAPQLDFQLDLPRSPSPAHIPESSALQQPVVAVHMDSEIPRDSLSPEPLNTTQHPGSKTHDIMYAPRNSELSQDTPTSHGESGSISLPKISDQPPRLSLPLSDGVSDYGDTRKSNPAIPAVNIHTVESKETEPEEPLHPNIPPTLPEESLQTQNLGVDPRRDTRRMTLGLRPLPPEDPADNPEQRANRIRSFYKEYFDESKNGRETTYYEDYGPDFYPDDGYFFDPANGDYFDAVPAPFAEPVTRRAMTPPPRAPPRFQGGPRHMTSGSMGGFSGYNSPGPRAFSSASGRLPGPRGMHKPVPPPAPLQVLPTPHMLNDDAIFGAIDYAPGKNLKDQREGRPETPLGGMRPFSPMTRAHTPLASAFDELSVMPSPHALRKSGAYDNLEFAPPPRFKNAETASETGSIRSMNTGISNAHLFNIRTGAYRVSRLPPDTVGTKDDLMSSLKPSWEMRK